MAHQMLDANGSCKIQAEFRKDDLQHRVNTKASHYDFLVRLDYYLPKNDSPLCTTAYLVQCYDRSIYCAQ